MKKILLIAALLIGTFSYSQVMLSKAVKYLGVTTTVRNSLTINANEFPVIYNTTTGQFERYNGATWEVWGVDYTETNDLSTVTWANIPDANVPQSAVTQHEAALSLTESQISDLQTYLTSADVLATTDQTIPALTIRDIDLGGNTASTSLVISEGVNSLFQVNGDGTANFQQSSPTVTDDAYGVGWNGDFKVPTKNAVYDKIETLGSGTPEGTAILSTGEVGGTKFLREDGDGTSSWQAIAGGGDALVANPLSQFAATTSAQLAGVLSNETGTGLAVFGTSPTLVTPALGTPSALVLTNATGLTSAGIVDGQVDETDLDTSTNASLDLADSALQAADISDTAYGVGWNADTGAASKNSIYDEMETRVDSDVTGVTGADVIDNIMSLTQAEYDLITPDSDTFYVITDATTQLTDLSDVNTATITNRNFLIADGVDWESRAATVADVSDLDADAATLTIGASATVTGSNTGDSQTLAAGVSDVTATASEINTPLDGASVTLTEFQELETIGATVISAADWTAVSNLVGTNTGDQTIEYKFIVPLGGSGTDLAVADDVTHVPVLDAITITRVEADVLTAPTGAGITLDIELDDGTPASIFSTLLTIDATERFTSTAATAAVVSDATIPADSFLTFNVDVIGSTIAGAGGTVTIYYTID